MNDRRNGERRGEQTLNISGTPFVMIGIINHNRSVDLIECVRSILNCTYPNFEIFLVDSGSSDDSVIRIREAFPSILLKRVERNLGPAGARNIIFNVAREKRPDYLLMLDNDTIVEKGFIEPLVDAMERNANAATAGGTILEYENPGIIWFAGGHLVPLRGLAVHDRKGEKFDRSNPGSVRQISFITSCMIMFRGSLLDKIGHQDERFFPRLEDIEHAARINRLGNRQLYVPESVIYHKVGGEKQSTFKLYYSVRNRLMLARIGFGGVSGTIAALYFPVVITLKLVFWRMTHPEFYVAAKAGLEDYFNGTMGEGRGMALFADTRTMGSDSGSDAGIVTGVSKKNR